MRCRVTVLVVAIINAHAEIVTVALALRALSHAAVYLCVRQM